LFKCSRSFNPFKAFKMFNLFNGVHFSQKDKNHLGGHTKVLILPCRLNRSVNSLYAVKHRVNAALAANQMGQRDLGQRIFDDLV